MLIVPVLNCISTQSWKKSDKKKHRLNVHCDGLLYCSMQCVALVDGYFLSRESNLTNKSFAGRRKNRDISSVYQNQKNSDKEMPPKW